jgi:hypothetical protein
MCCTHEYEGKGGTKKKNILPSFKKRHIREISLMTAISQSSMLHKHICWIHIERTMQLTCLLFFPLPPPLRHPFFFLLQYIPLVWGRFSYFIFTAAPFSHLLHHGKRCISIFYGGYNKIFVRTVPRHMDV